ncbi:GNAT family N-acetyltransferase [Streptomyces lavendofoliae]|uniref:N-acetyltransferase GCN5 n=1 Tax=Streptomyces lavendofoliae TaxID=67314 RepID=A0A918HWZ8_9ACTN|nr:GNAT family N-acetyltransferase [Streptomyces lavendofoliae]GGU39491.1 N-acetyltransferase GCN5 [Streptomyces lavendofoliae]
MSALQVSRATPEDWSVVREWAVAEGWNPGLRDVTGFFAQDPDGFFLGRLDGEREPVSAVSVVNYSDTYAFLGFYLVRPDRRGLGHGLATWRAALAHAGDRTVGLDGVPAQQDNYRRSGFALAHRSARWVGSVAGRAPGAGVVPAAEVGLAAIAAYDAGCHPAERPRFLERWLDAPGHLALARVVDGRVTGYGVIRPAHEGFRVGPLFADSAGDAEVLLDALVDGSGADRIAVDVPESNPAAVRMAEARGLVPTFATARMYTGPVRPFAGDRVFGITTLELG